MSNRTIAREREWEQRELLRDGLRFDGSGLDGTGGKNSVHQELRQGWEEGDAPPSRHQLTDDELSRIRELVVQREKALAQYVRYHKLMQWIKKRSIDADNENDRLFREAMKLAHGKSYQPDLCFQLWGNPRKLQSYGNGFSIPPWIGESYYERAAKIASSIFHFGKPTDLGEDHGIPEGHKEEM